jgi:hypothetical protein
MKMADGGFRPAFNGQFCTDTASQVIVGVAISNNGSDQGQMTPMLDHVANRYGRYPEHALVGAAGLGKIILAEAERRVRELWQATAMVMTVINVRTELIAWYERRGYRATGARLPFPFTATSGETTRDFDLVELRKEL